MACYPFSEQHAHLASPCISGDSQDSALLRPRILSVSGCLVQSLIAQLLASQLFINKRAMHIYSVQRLFYSKVSERGTSCLWWEQLFPFLVTPVFRPSDLSLTVDSP